MSAVNSAIHSSIPREFIDSLLARIDIVEIIAKHISLRKAGANYIARCPFHEEKTPSFSVSSTKQFFYCFGCGAHGDAIGFLMKYSHMSFVDAVKHLAARLGLDLPMQFLDPDAKAKAEKNKKSYDVLAEISNCYQRHLDKSPRALSYLKSRGLSREIIKRFAIGYAPPVSGTFARIDPDEQTKDLLLRNGLLKKNSTGEIYERFRDRIIFPIRDARGRIIAFGGRTLSGDLPKYLNSPETEIFHKGGELYGLFEAKEANRKFDSMIVVEGYMDVIALAQNEISNAVASMGTSITANQIEKLLRHTNEIIFSFDGDKAGKTAAWRALEIILPLLRDGLSIKFLFLPEGEDPDSYIRKNGRVAFSQYAISAMPLSEFLYDHLCQQAELGTLEGRAALAREAGKLLRKVQDGLFKELLWQKLAKLVHIDIDKLRDDSSKSFEKFYINNGDMPAKQMPKAVEMAINLLLHQPILSREITDIDKIRRLDLPFAELLAWLVHILQQMPDLSLGELFEKCANAEDAKILAKLALQTPLIPPSGLKNEFIGTINILSSCADEKIIDKLLSKANQTGLEPEEKQILLDLIAKNRSKSKN